MANVGGIYFWTQHDYNTLMQLLYNMQSQLAHVQASISSILTQERNTMAALDDLTAQVAANTSAEQSAVTLIQGLAAQIAAAVTNNDSAALEALAGQLNSSAAALGAAITANTPASPAPDPNAPQVTPQSARGR